MRSRTYTTGTATGSCISLPVRPATETRQQDLVQEAFIRVTRHLHRFDTSKKFSTWVYTIASNLSKNELRNRSRSPLVLFQRLTNSWDDDHRPIQFEDFRTRPDDLYRKRFLRRLVEDTVQELPEHHRLVFQLRELEGKSYEEISEITGVNLGTVKSRAAPRPEFVRPEDRTVPQLRCGEWKHVRQPTPGLPRSRRQLQG